MTGKPGAISVTAALLARPDRGRQLGMPEERPTLSNESDGAGDLQSPFPPATWVKVCPTRTREWFAPREPGNGLPRSEPGRESLFRNIRNRCSQSTENN
jgi:hypothetical protein